MNSSQFQSYRSTTVWDESIIFSSLPYFFLKKEAVPKNTKFGNFYMEFGFNFFYLKNEELYSATSVSFNQNMVTSQKTHSHSRRCNLKISKEMALK